MLHIYGTERRGCEYTATAEYDAQHLFTAQGKKTQKQKTQAGRDDPSGGTRGGGDLGEARYKLMDAQNALEDDDVMLNDGQARSW